MFSINNSKVFFMFVRYRLGGKWNSSIIPTSRQNLLNILAYFLSVIFVHLCPFKDIEIILPIQFSILCFFTWYYENLFLISMSLVIFCLFFSFVDYVPVKGEIIWYLSLTAWLISLSIMLSSSIYAVAKGISSFFLSAA